jgi:hypothetical protein
MINQIQEAASPFVVYFGVKNNKKINEEFILPLIRAFFRAKKIENPEKPEAVQVNAEISDLDFKEQEISYFYDSILGEISKNKEREVVFPVKYSITLDKENCPKECEKTGLFYDEILLYKKPIFYFIHLDIKDIFSFLREHPVENS